MESKIKACCEKVNTWEDTNSDSLMIKTEIKKEKKQILKSIRRTIHLGRKRLSSKNPLNRPYRRVKNLGKTFTLSMILRIKISFNCFFYTFFGIVVQITARRQAKSIFKNQFTGPIPVKRRVLKNRLKVHWFPYGPRLNVLCHKCLPQSCGIFSFYDIVKTDTR